MMLQKQCRLPAHTWHLQSLMTSILHMTQGVRFMLMTSNEVDVSYKEEANYHYCKPGSYVGSVSCSKCHVLFAVANSKSQVIFSFNLMSRKPAYACASRKKGCTHALCFSCFQDCARVQTEGNKNNNEGTRSHCSTLQKG